MRLPSGSLIFFLSLSPSLSSFSCFSPSPFSPSSASSSSSDSGSLSGAPNALAGLLLLRVSPGLAKEVSLPPASPELKPLPKTLPPKGFEAPPICPNGEDPLERLLPPKRDGVSELGAAAAAAAPNGEAEPDALANELRGLVPDWRKGEDDVAKPARPELLKADVDVALVSAAPAAEGVSDCFSPGADDDAALVEFCLRSARGSAKVGGVQRAAHG